MNLICPHCKKKIDTQKEKEEAILSFIIIKPRKISELCLLLDEKRSTLNYYLSKMESKGKLFRERNKKLSGRPTFIKIKKEVR